MHHGGAERVIASLCRNLDKNKFRVSVFGSAACGAIGEELLSQGYDVFSSTDMAETVSPYRKFLLLKKLLKDKDIDIIHTHDTGTLVDAAQCRLLGAKTRLVHTFHFGNYPHKKKYALLLESIFSRLANRLVAVGYEQAKIIAKTLHISPSRLETIYNGVELSQQPPESDLVEPYRNKENSPTIICSISTLTVQKGLSYLIDAADKLRRNKVNCVILIVGDGPLRQGLEERCQLLGLSEMVYFLGWVPNAATQLLPNIDIFCQSSLWEANSIALLEAMAAGIPIVTTNVGESRHIINEGENGNIVKPRDPDELASALAALVSDQQLRQVYSKNAQKDYFEKYTVEQMISNYSQLYESLV
jgi:glycosyltransferase involved in cell wall biosynthesis